MPRPVSNLVKLKGLEKPCLIDIDEVARGLEEGLVEYVLDEVTGERLDSPFAENKPKEVGGSGSTPSSTSATSGDAGKTT